MFIEKEWRWKGFLPLHVSLVLWQKMKKKRRVELQIIIRQKKASVIELKNGYSIEFSDTGVWVLVAEFVTLESKCCPFFKFALIWKAENVGVKIEITGRDGVKEFLKAEMNLNT